MLRQSHTDNANFYEGRKPHDLLEQFGSPLYVYNERILRQRCRELVGLSSHGGFAVNYSVKANSNPHLLAIIREEGLRVDAMSPGELGMDIMAGYKPRDILYISNNNMPEEMLNALSSGCLISVDSLSQLDMLGGLEPGARVMVRINPGIGEGHHAKVITGGKDSKFGISPRRMPDILALVKKHKLVLAGLNQHIGSLFMQPGNYIAAAQTLLEIAASLPADIFRQMEILDFGGGFGIPYHKYDHEERLDLAALGSGFHALISGWASRNDYSGSFLVEPGRYVVAECGLLLGRCAAVKDNGYKRFVGTDMGFNTLMRPVLYNSFHDLEVYGDHEAGEPVCQTVVGNICESGDILAKDRLLPPIEPGDAIAVLDAGAYGFSMASNYNARYLPAEVLLTENGDARLIRRRQTLADLQTCLTGLGD